MLRQEQAKEQREAEPIWHELFNTACLMLPVITHVGYICKEIGFCLTSCQSIDSMMTCPLELIFLCSCTGACSQGFGIQQALI